MLDFGLLVVVMSAPLILAAMGGYASERGGVINIGLEGIALISACVTALVSAKAGAPLGVAAGVGSSVALALLHWLATQQYRIDHVISGMAINAIAAGGTNFMYGKFADKAAGEIPQLPLPTYWGLALVLPFGIWAYTRGTRGGLRLVSVGSDPDKARLMGINPQWVRFGGLLGTGVFCGLAGAMLVTDTGTFSDNMTAGRGYIALAALIVGGWRPIPTFFACLAFGFFSAVRLQLQGSDLLGASIPSQAWAALPYIVTIVALAGFLGRNRTPAGLGKP